jgi:hypothetical protein
VGESLWPYILDFVRGAFAAAVFSLIFGVLWGVAFVVLGAVGLLSGWKSEKAVGSLALCSGIVSVVGGLWLCGPLIEAATATPVRASGLFLAALAPAALNALASSLPAAAPPSKLPSRANDLPVSSYLSWPLPVAVALVLASLLGAYSGSGGTPRGFLIALLLNPILWGAGWALWKIGQLRCPHCRRGIGSTEVRNAAVGSPVCCGKCGNWSTKPAG